MLTQDRGASSPGRIEVLLARIEVSSPDQDRGVSSPGQDRGVSSRYPDTGSRCPLLTRIEVCPFLARIEVCPLDLLTQDRGVLS
jgi:hypothetical protein